MKYLREIGLALRRRVQHIRDAVSRRVHRLQAALRRGTLRTMAVLRRLCVLPVWLSLLIALATFALLLWALFTDVPQFVRFTCYQLSTYGLVVSVTAAVRVRAAYRRARGPNGLLTRFEQTPLGYLLMRDPAFRATAAIYLTLAWNLVVALVKLLAGLLLRSNWLVTLSTYYLVLALLRLLIVRPSRHGEGPGMALLRYRLCGRVLLAMNLVLAAVVVQAVLEKGVFRYPGPLIYLMAAYAFWAVTSATVKLFKSQRRDDLMFSAAKAVSLTAALVSMFSLEVAMIARFGDGGGLFRPVMVGALGSVVCLVELGLARYMIRRANQGLGKLKEEGDGCEAGIGTQRWRQPGSL